MSNVLKLLRVEPPTELDVVTVDEFAETLENALGEGPDVLVVDFTRVEFVSAVGVELLRDIQQALSARGARLRVTRASWQVRQLLSLSGADFESS